MKFKNIISAGLLATLLITSIPFGISKAEQNSENNTLVELTNQDTAKVKNKSEVVYGTLTADGNVNGLYVVNHFEIEKGGVVTDYGDYNSVLNLTDSNQIIQNGDNNSFSTESGNFYYQGNMESTELPWDFVISYELDGVKLTSKELAGKSGKLTITIKTTKNNQVNTAFYDNYMLQISLSLDADKCSNISAPNATIADAGNNKMLVFTAMPGKNADYQVKADVVDFTMNGIEISGMPFSMSVDIPDTDGMLSDLNKLPEAINELNKGVGELTDGTSKLNKGANELKNGSGEIKNGLLGLKYNSSSITSGSTKIKDALTLISSSLENESTGTDLSELTQLPVALNDLSTGLKGISSGLNELKNGYSSAYTALDMVIHNTPDTAITQEQINKQFPNATKEQSELLNQLYMSYAVGQTVKGTYGQVKQAFASVVPTIETLSVNIDKISGGLDNISSNLTKSLDGTDITAQLSQLTKGLTELATNYESFDKGLKEYMNGVGKLSDGFQDFDAGFTKFQGGVSSLDSGVSELFTGTNKLNDEVSKIPDTMQDEMDKLMDEYSGTDFVKTSFISSKNSNTELVQFVLKCGGIKKSEETSLTNTSAETKQKETIWDRFIALFKKTK